MTRYAIEDRNGRLVATGDGETLPIGTMDDVVAGIGGETYTISYDETQQTQPWLETTDGDLEIDVRDAVTTLRFGQEVFDALAGASMDESKYGMPERSVKFADIVVDIWEEQGRNE